MPLVRDIEMLARLHADGTLSTAQHEAARQAMLDDVPEAEAVVGPSPLDEALDILARCLLPPLGGGGLVFLIGIPAMLSLTLGVTMMAGLLVAQYRDTEPAP